MGQAPAWLSYASPAIALLSLALATVAFRRQSVRLRCSAKALWDFKLNLSEKNHGHWRAAIVVNLHNKTIQPVGVDAFVIYRPGIARNKLRRVVRSSDIIRGPALSYTLPGRESKRWDLAVESLTFNGEEITEPGRILAILENSSIFIELGTGRPLVCDISMDQAATRYD